MKMMYSIHYSQEMNKINLNKQDDSLYGAAAKVVLVARLQEVLSYPNTIHWCCIPLSKCKGAEVTNS